MMFYDYDRVPLHVADAAFAELMAQPNPDILELPVFLIKHCDQWCDDNQALNEQDNRVDVITRLQGYIHATYGDEITRLMRAKINKYRQAEHIRARLHERRN
jgi:uncharacterized protein YuzB (UPF0349 family)